MLNVIRNLKNGAAANLQYTIPTSGAFLAVWEFNGNVYSASYKYDGETLTAFNDELGKYVDATDQTTDDHYSLGDLLEMANSGGYMAQFIGVITLETA